MLLMHQSPNTLESNALCLLKCCHCYIIGHACLPHFLAVCVFLNVAINTSLDSSVSYFYQQLIVSIVSPLTHHISTKEVGNLKCIPSLFPGKLNGFGVPNALLHINTAETLI